MLDLKTVSEQTRHENTRTQGRNSSSARETPLHGQTKNRSLMCVQWLPRFQTIRASDT